MSKQIIKRLPAVKSLYEILPKGVEGGKEFARIVDLLLFHEARRENKKVSIFNDAAGDYFGLDSFGGDAFRKEGTVGYQYKFYPSPLSSSHRAEIKDSLKKAVVKQNDLKLKKWILVTPQDLIQSAKRKELGDVSWFEGLKAELGIKFEIEHWGHTKLQKLFLETPFLCLFYYPELTPNQGTRRTIEDTRRRYDDNLTTLYRNIEFVGMSVYKQDATRGVPMEHIYIPLTVIPESISEADEDSRIEPLTFLNNSGKYVILGDPGSGKSTLLRFLSLVGGSKALQKRSKAKPDKRLPILIVLRRYADELKNRQNLSLIDYIQECIQGDFNLNSANLDFFEYYLETGQAILLFDGLDELPNSNFKQIIKDRIRTLVTTYPGNTVLVSSRIVGYEGDIRFDKHEFSHFKLTKLQLSEMERFVEDWYNARIDNPQERQANADDLIRILRNEDLTAIRELAENPLLLTIVALVHRIDAVLPDERVVLYQKCTETLLNTWQTWKDRGAEIKNRGREERRDRKRIEAIANWMHKLSLGTDKDQRAVVSYDELHKFLTDYVTATEKPYDQNNEPEDIATEFLEFVKKKAGLLIEVGDSQYSFVHQTFQEYLTAAFIITTSEAEGIEKIWHCIKDYCNSPRWIEVIRLLIALRSTASQAILLEKILTDKPKSAQSTRAQLLGGLLLDGIEPAEIRTKEIIGYLLETIVTTSETHFRSLMSILRSWSNKESADENPVVNIFQEKWIKAKDNEKLRLNLLSLSFGWKTEEIIKIDKNYPANTKDENKLNLFFSSKQVDYSSLKSEYDDLWLIQDYLSLQSPFGNYTAAVLDALTASLPPEILYKRLFFHQLKIIGSGYLAGPYSHYLYNSFVISCKKNDFEDKILKKLTVDFSRNKASSRTAILSKAIRNATNSKLEERLEKIPLKSKEIRNQIIRARGFHIDEDAKKHINTWSKYLVSPQYYGPAIDVICDCFKLKDKSFWTEAIKNFYLISVPSRIDFFQLSKIKTLEKKISEGKLSSGDIYESAWYLIFDVWLFGHKSYNLQEQSKFKRLAALTQSIDAAPLRIAHCIRDLAFGNRSREEDLFEMVLSGNPEYRSIFEACYWR